MPPIPEEEQGRQQRSIRDVVAGIGFHDMPGTETPIPNQMPASSLGVPRLTRQGELLQPQIQPGSIIPPNLMHEAGRAAYQQILRDLEPTAPVGTAEWNLQEQARQRFLAQHHPGNDISAIPGIGGKILHGLALAGNIAGDIIAPGVMEQIPGTMMHRQAVAADLQRTYPQEVSAQVAQAEIPIRQQEAQTAAAQARTAETRAQLEQQKFEEGDLLQTQEGLFSRGPQGIQPIMYNGQQLDPKQAEGNYQTQAFQDLKREGYSTQQALGIMAAAQNASKNDPARDQAMKSYMATHRGATPYEAYMNTNPPPQAMFMVPAPGGGYQAQTVRGGQTLAPGAVPSGQFGKVTATEQNRADYADNLNENLDNLEDIVRRRPELFGPVHGRITQVEAMVGSDDPDITTLRNIKDNIGRVNQSVHGMRGSNQVESASNAVLHWGDGPDGIMGAIKSARASAATFSKNVQQIRQTGTAQPTGTRAQPAAPAAQGGAGGRVRTYNPNTGQIE
jgi:hypothetical protein